ncbi:hypothetical protein D3093_34025 (plasmid) [Azospirillum argentinense]|uniref:Lipoprotein n=1 Tax=Azospirillum argentinense TaxID=2970906 RepID=A0A4D8PSE2_9PROT|nr:hypothetical protein [Azospirillum argentinense]QCO00255.1 hypothetical protein D3093_34025 [Azospirillum argentinense]
MVRPLLALCALILAGCSSGGSVDLPRQRIGGGMDDRQRSPCACVELPLSRSPAGLPLVPSAV